MMKRVFARPLTSGRPGSAKNNQLHTERNRVLTGTFRRQPLLAATTSKSKAIAAQYAGPSRKSRERKCPRNESRGSRCNFIQNRNPVIKKKSVTVAHPPCRNTRFSSPPQTPFTYQTRVQ